ncbi:BolA family protein [Sphingorhabdus sp. Alg239-R122]|uniref:BolA family protein n=1 Tax=Sphingorhabdus sp. Alg239-R122 TaxID=2305989 RepID=UPI0013DA260C|nr:BolA family protein [Sphingorhabdus sp. Alg239-R122]
MGEVEQEIIKRLTEALSPTRLVVNNDSAQHRGHAGDDGSGESHFSVEVESAAFTGKNRVQQQRMVNAALGNLMDERIHAMAIKTQVAD